MKSIEQYNQNGKLIQTISPQEVSYEKTNGAIQNNVYAQKVLGGNQTYYYVATLHGGPYDFNSKTPNLSNQQITMKRVNKAVFDGYIMYLQTKNDGRLKKVRSMMIYG